MNPTVLPTADAPVSLAEQVYQSIKQRILNQTYPEGTALTEAMLSEEFGISKTPIKTAIARLTADGFLEAGFRKKVYVKAITEEEILEYYELRMIVERAAVERIFQDDKTWDFSFLLEEALLHMRANVGDFFAFETADAELHRNLITAFQNNRILRMYDAMNDELVRMNTWLYQYNIANNQAYAEEIIDGFQKFILAIRDKDQKAALHYLLDVHMGISKEQALRAVRAHREALNPGKGK